MVGLALAVGGAIAAAGGSIRSSRCASDDDGDLGHVELVAF
jgi:hypothetical protein